MGDCCRLDAVLEGLCVRHYSMKHELDTYSVTKRNFDHKWFGGDSTTKRVKKRDERIY